MGYDIPQYQECDRNDARSFLRGLLVKLPPKPRAALVLREVEDCTYDEIAALLGYAHRERSRQLRGKALQILRNRVGDLRLCDFGLETSGAWKGDVRAPKKAVLNLDWTMPAPQSAKPRKPKQEGFLKTADDKIKERSRKTRLRGLDIVSLSLRLVQVRGWITNLLKQGVSITQVEIPADIHSYMEDAGMVGQNRLWDINVRVSPTRDLSKFRLHH